MEVFREVKRVLRGDGVLFLNLGDSYNGSGGWGGADTPTALAGSKQTTNAGSHKKIGSKSPGLKPKDLCGIPWRVALALQSDGWWLRSDIIWAKPNPMPESCTDRPTKAHEYIFLLTKAAHYFYDAEAVKQVAALSSEKRGPVDFGGAKGRAYEPEPTDPNYRYGNHQAGRTFVPGPTANLRSVWTIATAPFPEAHFATYPPELVRRCVAAGTSQEGCCSKCGAPWKRCVEKVDSGKRQKMADGWDTGPGGHGTVHRDGREKGQAEIPVMQSTTTGWRPTCTCDAGEPVPCTVLDPFGGSGTTGLVAAKMGRDAVLIELKPEYAVMAAKRIRKDLGMLATVEVIPPSPLPHDPPINAPEAFGDTIPLPPR